MILERGKTSDLIWIFKPVMRIFQTMLLVIGRWEYACHSL
jgi:hypothetical protein